VVITASLGARLAGGGGYFLTVLQVDILGYMVGLLPWNVPAFFSRNISAGVKPLFGLGALPNYLSLVCKKIVKFSYLFRCDQQ
jgi:hypothetical protein